MPSNMNGAELSLQILDIAFPEGFGVARQNDLVYFVPGALPGDRVRVRVVAREKERFRFGQIVAIEQESPFRVTPACAHTGVCGGCVFQNLLYEKQLELKENYLAQTLRRIGDVHLGQVEVAPIVPSVEQYYYRGKVEIFFGEQGSPSVGFRERVSPFESYTGRLVPIRHCPIFSATLERLLPLFSEYAVRVHAVARVKRTNQSLLRKVIVREAKWDKKLMISLVVSGKDITEGAWLLERVRRDFPELASLSAITKQRKELLLGTPYMEEMLGQQRFRVYPQTFFQPNTLTAERLYESIAALCRAGTHRRVLGLYCGTGPIEIGLSSFTGKIVGVDSDAENIAAAIENCRINQIRNCQFYRQTAERASGLRISGPFDLIVIDPPRAGLTPDALRFILGQGVPRLIYVSCNPSTLARDLKRLREARYLPKKIIPFDFFPHGAHVETLVLLENG